MERNKRTLMSNQYNFSKYANTYVDQQTLLGTTYTVLLCPVVEMRERKTAQHSIEENLRVPTLCCPLTRAMPSVRTQVIPR